jgi:cell division septal protein FtsQ
MQVAWIALAIGIGYLLFTAYRGAASASFFQLRGVDVGGASKTSPDEIKAVARRAVGSNGIWNADLHTVSSEIVERVPGVRNAVVSRVLPDGLRVRVIERIPIAVVRTTEGRMVWVDEDAVALDAMSPSDRVPAYFIRGWDEARTENAKSENRDRVKKYLETLKEWEHAGLTGRISEVDLSDLRDIRVQLSGADSKIEVRLGGDDLGARLGRALKVLDDQRSTACGPFITYLVATQKNTIIGVPPGAQPCALAGKPGDDSGNDLETVKTGGRNVARASSPPASKQRDKRSRR